MPSPVLLVTGLTEILTSIRAQPAAVAKEIRSAFRAVGDTKIVPAAAQGILDLDPPSDKTAAGFRTVVRATGVVVEQSLRKTTGRRPDWGMNQMKYGLYPATDDNLDAIEAAAEKAMQKAASLIGLA